MVNTPTSIDLLKQGRERVARAWTRAQFSYVGDGIMYVCALGGLTPAVLEESDDIAHFWSLEYDYSDICGIPNGMQCDASSWLANAIRELYPDYARMTDANHRTRWLQASREERMRCWYATTEQPRWSLDNPLIVEFNDTAGRTQSQVIDVYDVAIKRCREAAEATAGLVATRTVATVAVRDEELVVSGD